MINFVKLRPLNTHLFKKDSDGVGGFSVQLIVCSSEMGIMFDGFGVYV
jgi:hypothetical protein